MGNLGSSLWSKRLCLKSLVRLSFRPGFSPVNLALESPETVLTVYSSSDLQEVPLSTHKLGRPARGKPLKRFLGIYGLLHHRAKARCE